MLSSILGLCKGQRWYFFTCWCCRFFSLTMVWRRNIVIIGRGST